MNDSDRILFFKRMSSRNLHVSSLSYIPFFSSECGKLFFRQSIRLHSPAHPLSVSLGPVGLQLGAAASFAIYVGTGDRQLCGPRVLLSLQNRKNTLLSDEHWRHKNTPGARGSRLRRMITFQLVPNPFLCAWSRLEGGILCQLSEHMGCSVSS